MSDQAFVQLVDSHYASLYRFALSLARNSADACDLVQQTFLIWGTKGASLRDSRKARTWLFTTLYREFLRLRRYAARATPVDDLPVEPDDLAQDDVDRVRRADASHVMTALQSIPETYRAPLTLFYLDSLSYQEIADALDIPIGTVMSRLSRGKAQLRRLIVEPSAAGDGKVVPFDSSQEAKSS